MVDGNTQHRYKEAVTMLEESSPGTKQQMYFGFLRKAAHRFESDAAERDVVACSECGGPTVMRPDDAGRSPALCSFCRTKALARRRRAARTSDGV